MGQNKEPKIVIWTLTKEQKQYNGTKSISTNVWITKHTPAEKIMNLNINPIFFTKLNSSKNVFWGKCKTQNYLLGDGLDDLGYGVIFFDKTLET